VGKHIVVKGSPAFQSKVLADLGKIAQTPSADHPPVGPPRPPAGATTLANIDNGRHDVTITSTSGGNGTAPKPMADAQDPTKGTHSTISYNSTFEPNTAANPAVKRPADVGLHHELVHADNASQGKVDLSPATNPNNPHKEEDNTIARDNQYRDDRGIPRRADHTVF
jgi:hypothetical protein